MNHQFKLSQLGNSLVAETVRAMIEAAPAPDSDKPDPLWELLAAAEMPWVGVGEAAGGVGGGVIDQAEIIATIAAGARSVPLTETGFLAGWLIETSGLTMNHEVVVPLIASIDDELITGHRAATGWRLRGRVRSVPFGRYADEFLALATLDGATRVVRIDPKTCELGLGNNVAGEPRDTVTLADVSLAETDVGETSPLLSAGSILARAALGRALQISGALRAVQRLTVSYAGQRSQFGRPIAEFQAVANHLTLIAGEVAAAEAVTEAAISTCAATGSDCPASPDLVAKTAAIAAVAKARTTSAAIRVATSAHQIHGAMGVSAEYPLGQLTKRLWSWATEYGDERFWHRRLGTVTADSELGLWRSVLAVGERTQ